MDSNHLNSLIFFVVLVILSAFFSSSETAFTSVSRIRLKHAAEDGDKRADDALGLQEDFESLLSTILIGNNLVNIASSAIATLFFVELSPRYGATIATIVTTVTLLLFGEITPKLLAKVYSESVTKSFAPLLKFVMKVLSPFVWIFGQWQRFVKRVIPMSSNDRISEEELLSIVDEARMGGSIEREEHALVRAAIEFDDMEISSILTPRVDVVAFDINDSDKEIEDLFLRTPYSRLIVYDESIENIEGTLHAKDFYRYLDAQKNDYARFNSLTELLTKPLFVPPNISPSALLEAMQREHTHVGIILDEYGTMIGIATMEDVLEELVGEIWDESDVVRTDIIQLKNSESYLIQGTYSLEKFFDLFNIQNEEEWHSNTLSGFLMEQFERIPGNNEVFHYQNIKITIVNAQRRRVNEVVVERLSEDEMNQEEALSE